MRTIEDLVAETGARRSHSGFVADCPQCGYRNALSIKQGEKAALVTCHAGCDRVGLLRSLAMGKTSGVVHGEPHRKADDRSSLARAIWDEAVEARCTIAESYLRSRAIDLEIPRAIRFHPLTRHPDTSHHPAMIAAVTLWPNPYVVAIHRTYLNPAGTGKADLDPQRASLGPIRGGAVKLGEVVRGEPLVVSEGIETGLSVMQVQGLTVWAALSTGGLRALRLPNIELVPEIIIAADADGPGIAAARESAERWCAEGRLVRIATPSIAGADFNDILRASQL